MGVRLVGDIDRRLPRTQEAAELRVLSNREEDPSDLKVLVAQLQAENRQLRMALESAGGGNAATADLLADLQRARDHLQDSESYLKTLLDTAAVGIITVDAATHRILEVNSFALRLIGRPAEELVGDVCHNLICKAERGKCPITDLGHNVDQSERILLAAGNTEIPVLKTVRPVQRGGATILIETFVDLRPIKRAEAEARAKEAAEAACQARTEFLAHMSHEIRTPMNGILGMVDLALATPLRPDQREYLQIVRNSAECLLTVINDILDFSRIEARKLILHPAPTDLRQAVAEIMRILSPEAYGKGIELIGDIRPEVPPVLLLDAIRVRQILLNLLGNAIKFTEHGEVRLRVGLEGAAAEQATVRFEVCDTGPGIAPEYQARIFQAFEQGDTSETRQHGGTGLGLTISSRLVGLMGGQFTLKSELGKGSVFSFSLAFPVVTAEPAADGSGSECLRGSPVLGVTANARCRDLMQQGLMAFGLRPQVVSDAPGAIEELARAARAGTPFPLVLADAELAGTSGYELAAEIRSRFPQPPSLILLLGSPDSYPGDVNLAELGIVATLIKPCSEVELHRTVVAALTHRQIEAPPDIRDVFAERRSWDVLVAEDNPVNQKVISRTLEKWGCTVALAADGMDAVEMTAKHEFHVVLMDLEMPRMGGLEATAMIRARESAAGRHTPIIALTAHAMAEHREQCLNSGVDSYLTKPVRAGELLSTIDEVLTQLGLRSGSPSHAIS